MDEAEYLCDRIGIFVDGNFQCLGTSDEVTSMTLPTSLQLKFRNLTNTLKLASVTVNC